MKLGWFLSTNGKNINQIVYHAKLVILLYSHSKSPHILVYWGKWLGEAVKWKWQSTCAPLHTMFVFQMAISACTVYQIAFNLFSDVGCAWTRESMAGVLSALSGWCPYAMEKPSILPCKSKDYLSYQWALDPEALAEALGSSIVVKPWGTLLGNDSPLNVKKNPVYVSSFKNKATSTASTTSWTTTHLNKWDQMKKNAWNWMMGNLQEISGNAYTLHIYV